MVCSRPPRLPKASPSIPSTLAISDCSLANSADVFFLAMVILPCQATWRGLNSGCAPEGTNTPAWCRGYHAGLSFLRPGFNSRSGRQTPNSVVAQFLSATNRLRKEDYSDRLSWETMVELVDYKCATCGSIESFHRERNGIRQGLWFTSIHETQKNRHKETQSRVIAPRIVQKPPGILLVHDVVARV